MRIEIVDSNGDEINHFELECNPFKVGENIHISVSNKDKSFWMVDEVDENYTITKIHHSLRKDYTNSGKLYTYFTVTVEVSKI